MEVGCSSRLSHENLDDVIWILGPGIYFQSSVHSFTLADEKSAGIHMCNDLQWKEYKVLNGIRNLHQMLSPVGLNDY